MKYSLFVLYFLLGIGRNLPDQAMYWYGVGIPDVLFVIFLIITLSIAHLRNGLVREVRSSKGVARAIVVIGALASLSLYFNMSIYGAHAKDLLEILRYFYSYAILLFTAFAIKRCGLMFITAFPIGVIFTGVVAFMNPMNSDVLGTPQIYNPNVIGNALAVSVLLASILILKGSNTIGALLGVISASLAFFTFSKGTWLMASLGVVACMLALKMQTTYKSKSLLRRLTKLTSGAILIGLIFVAYENYDLISNVVEAKIKATEFDSSAAEGGSFAARSGLILSATYMGLTNPLLGVGISNFEIVNRALEPKLGGYFYDDDNPNSAFFYVLGCMGVVAFIAFCYIFFAYVKSLRDLVQTRRLRGTAYVLIGALIILIGGNVQLEMLTAYYFWVLFGLVKGCRHDLKDQRDILVSNHRRRLS